MKKSARKLLAGFAGLLLFGLMTVQVKAAGSVMVVEKYTTDAGVILYVKGTEGAIEEAAYQVGTTPCTVNSIVTVDETEETIRTLILWDNSISVMNKCETTVKDILKDVVANRAAGEEFAIATIGEEITYLTDFSGDYASLKQIIDGVTGEDKDAYIIENLYEAIASFNAMQDCGYKRIILISDGMDATEIGYSRSELDTLIAGTPYPIYTIGVLSKNSQEELQNMFALSRTTGVDYFYLDEIEDPMSVVQSLSADYDILQVEVTVPEEIQNGSTQNSQLSLVSGAETYQVQCEVVLPFLTLTASEETVPEETLPEETLPEETVVEETTTEETAVAETTQEDVTETEDKTSFFDKKISLFGMELPLVLIIGVTAGLVILIVLIIVIIAVSKSKKKKAMQQPDNSYEILDQKLKNERNSTGPQNVQVNMSGNAVANTAANSGAAGRATRALAGMENGSASQVQAPVGSTPTGGMNKTQLLFDGTTGAPAVSSGHRVVLTNVADVAMTYQCGMTDKIIIGRNPACTNIAITTDNAVSEKHCEIGITGNKFYIKDLGSSNGTIVNGCKITVMTEVTTGCILKLGRSEYRIIVE